MKCIHLKKNYELATQNKNFDSFVGKLKKSSAVKNIPLEVLFYSFL